MIRMFPLLSQQTGVPLDSVIFVPDTTVTSSRGRVLQVATDGALDQQVTYSAEGYKRNDMVNRTAILHTKAKVTYGNIEITADSIVFDMARNTVYATGLKDSTGKLAGTPVFREGSQVIESRELTYNFRTKKAIAFNILTKQEDGLLRSQVTKLLEDGTSNIASSTYSTCDADPPHFYINLPRARVYPGKKIISGPGNLVLEGIPLPIAIPFGFFPIQTKSAASGILVPRIGQERERGYNLSDGGYYFAINDNFDLALRGSIYTNGTWMATAATNYNRLYKYSGNFSFSYANNILGHKGLSDYRKESNYKIGWNFMQDAKARPGSRFSASVNMSSSGYDKTNSYSVSEHVTTQRQSSVSYSRTWDGTPFNLSASMNHSQNVRNKTVSLNLPKINFNTSRIYPLKSRRNPGPSKWYQELQFQYTASVDNQINTYDSLLFTNKVWNNMRSGFRHEAPLSLQLRPFRNFSVSPQVSYTGVLYTRKIEKRWDPGYIDPETFENRPSVINDTINGLFYGHSFRPSVSASFNPQLYGTYTFTSPDSRVQAVRHVMRPSVGFSFIPAFKGLSSDLYRTVQRDTSGRMSEYSVFEGNIFGTPSLSKRSGSVNFSLINIIEAKVFQKNDTTGKPVKVKVIDNLGVNTSYNIFADSMRWAPVSLSMRTTLLENFNISANSSFSLYALDKNGRPTGRYQYSVDKRPLRLTGFSVSLDFDAGKLFRKDSQTSVRPQTQQVNEPAMSQAERAMMGQSGFAGTQGQVMTDAYGYPVFDVPWSMYVRYNLNYSKGFNKSQLNQTLSVNGNLSLTKKMTITYTSGYDFRMKDITMTQIGISRDLHCWDMSFNWIPNGTMQMWNFTIRVKAPILSDLKYERRKDYHDNF